MYELYENDPFVPIVVNKQGEAIRPHNCNLEDSDEFFREQFHMLCEGIVKISTVSATSKVLYCQKCGLRRYFPKAIKTYGQLRTHFIKAMGLERLRVRKSTPRKLRRKVS